MKICIANDKGSVGKTTLMKQLFMPRMPATEKYGLDPINRIAVGASPIDMGELESLIYQGDRDIIVDMGSLGSHSAISLFHDAPAVHRAINLFVVPITPKSIVDTESYVDHLLGADVDPKKILVIVNQLNDRGPFMTAAIERLRNRGIFVPEIEIPDFDSMPALHPADSVSKIAELAMEAPEYYEYRKKLPKEQRKDAGREVVLGRSCWRARDIFDVAFEEIQAYAQGVTANGKENYVARSLRDDIGNSRCARSRDR